MRAVLFVVACEAISAYIKVNDPAEARRRDKDTRLGGVYMFVLLVFFLMDVLELTGR